MRKLQRTISVSIATWGELSGIQRELMTVAMRARTRAYCPDSEYAVGAAVRTLHGQVFAGQNVEVADLSSTSHAEEAAITVMRSAWIPRSGIRAVAIVAAPKEVPIHGPEDAWGEAPLYMHDIAGPCGRCRQIIQEFSLEKQSPDVLILQPNFEVAIATLHDLFPMSFGRDDR